MGPPGRPSAGGLEYTTWEEDDAQRLRIMSWSFADSQPYGFIHNRESKGAQIEMSPPASMTCHSFRLLFYVDHSGWASSAYAVFRFTI
jgi:hypothetical protein